MAKIHPDPNEYQHRDCIVGRSKLGNFYVQRIVRNKRVHLDWFDRAADAERFIDALPLFGAINLTAVA